MYGILFTHLPTRAIHLEIAYNLDTDSCINATNGFMTRRGYVKMCLSNNGTSLLGVERDMRKEINMWNPCSYQEAMQQKPVT